MNHIQEMAKIEEQQELRINEALEMIRRIEAAKATQAGRISFKSTKARRA